MNEQKSRINFSARWAALGPGILLAGSAVGTSHIVQSTRAGADFGLGFCLSLFLLLSLNILPLALVKIMPTRQENH